MAIAVHSTRLGPALGGARLWHYERDDEGVADALRLAEAMTYKAAAAGLDLGGGKGVICAPVGGAAGRRAPAGDPARLRRPRRVARRPLHHRRGRRHRDRGHGRDRDAHHPRDRDAGRAGRRRRPEPVHRARRPGRDARRVPPRLRHARPGRARRSRWSGSATSASASRAGLRRTGPSCTVADIDPAKRALAGELGAEWLDPDAALLAAVRRGRAVRRRRRDPRRERRGAPLPGRSAARRTTSSPTRRWPERLAGRGILYAPDFIANAGGLINVYRELHSYDAERAMALVARDRAR